MEEFYTSTRGKANANLIPESNAFPWQAVLSESPPVRCFQVEPRNARAESAGSRGQKATDRLIQEFAVRGIAGGARGVAPQRRNRRQDDARNKGRLVTRVSERKIEIGFRGHVEQRNLDRTECAFYLSVEPGRTADVMLLPGASLQDVV